jgi:pimeloyl-ACP methyl ester carboxylesterase
MRRALKLSVADTQLFGTLHEQVAVGCNSPCRVGVLLVSFGQQPRSWVGDLGAALAERIAGAGYTTFRFDMPGLGDSPGKLPVHLESLWREIQLGSHVPYLYELCEKLQRDYDLTGLIVGGFCGGAATALYAANAGNFRLSGLLLFEPEIALTDADADSSRGGAGQLRVDDYLNRRKDFRTRIFSGSAWRHVLTEGADFKYWYRFLAHSGLRLVHRMTRKRKLPAETNHRVLDAWHVARQHRIPTLVLSVGSEQRTQYYKAYGLDAGSSNPRSQLDWIEVPNTTHAMLTGGAKEVVCSQVVTWLGRSFS